MDKNDLWNLFRLTGKIEYYLKYKEKEEKNESRRSNGNNREWNKLWRN